MTWLRSMGFVQPRDLFLALLTTYNMRSVCLVQSGVFFFLALLTTYIRYR
jgi:hypothetical protein